MNNATRRGRNPASRTLNNLRARNFTVVEVGSTGLYVAAPRHLLAPALFDGNEGQSLLSHLGRRYMDTLYKETLASGDAHAAQPPSETVAMLKQICGVARGNAHGVPLFDNCRARQLRSCLRGLELARRGESQYGNVRDVLSRTWTTVWPDASARSRARELVVEQVHAYRHRPQSHVGMRAALKFIAQRLGVHDLHWV